MQPSTVLLLLLAAALISVQAVPLSDWTSGTASFFGGPQDTKSNAYQMTIDSGSCGYGDFDPRLYPFYHVVGLHKSNPLVVNRPMAACGSCLEIQCVGDESHCAKRDVIPVIITDQCEYNCDSTTVNVHVFGFKEVAPLNIGRTPVRYRLVECEPTDPVTVHISDYRATDGGWIRLALKNVAGDAALIKVELAPAGASKQAESGKAAANWMPFTNTHGAVWEAGIGGVALPTPPLDLRITNSLGQQLIIEKFVSTAGMVGDVETTAQFPSPFKASSTKNGTSSDSTVLRAAESFVPPTLQAVQAVTVGKAIDKPMNTLYPMAMNNNTGPVGVPMRQQQSNGAATPSLKIKASEDKSYPGGAAPANNIALSGNQASRGSPAQLAQPPNQTPQVQPTNPAAPASMPKRTPVSKPLPTFARATPAKPASPTTRPATAEPSHVQPKAPGKQGVITKKTGTRRMMKA